MQQLDTPTVLTDEQITLISQLHQAVTDLDI
jgi:hypothetical protein